MPTPSVQVLGVYRVEATVELFAQAVWWKYRGVTLSREDRRIAEGTVREELSDAVLVEVLVKNHDADFDVGDFKQRNSDQAPYSETFLSEDGTTVISSGYEIPAGPTLRIAFFLHFFDSALPLESSYGSLVMPMPQPMPQRLAELVPHEPVA